MEKGKFWEKREIFPSITTISEKWRGKIEELAKFKINEVCLFVTNLNPEQKKEAFQLLQKTPLKKIPFVHLRSDSTPEEIEFLIDRYKTKVFNIHSEKDFPLKHDLSKFRQITFVENLVIYPLDEKEVKNYAGVCIDFSHLEISKHKNPEIYRKNKEIIDKFKCGCNHISAYKLKFDDDSPDIRKSCHYFTSLSQFDYLKNYPNKYFSKYLALEIENSIEEQLKAREYIRELLKDK